MTDDVDPIIITSASSPKDIDQIVYGLHLRGIRVKVVESKRGSGERYNIILDSRFAFIAKQAIDGIWDAILEDFPRAVTLDGLCAFCRYDVRSLPRPTVCPECGVNLDSPHARRALRDGKTPHKPDPSELP